MWVLYVYLLTLIHRHLLNWNCFRFHGYLWISVSKQTDIRAGTSRSGILVSWWVSCICCCRPCFYINFHAVYELTCSNDFRDKHGVLKLMVGAQGPLRTIYRVTWYLRLLVLSILTCSPNMSVPARLVSDNSGSLEILELGLPPPQPPLRKQFLPGVRVFLWLPAR